MKIINDDGAVFTIDSIQVVEIAPDDVVVVRVGYPLNAERTRRIHSVVSQFFPHNKVLVLDSAVTLEVTRSANEKP